MQGPTRVIVARIERHPYGLELVIAFEDGDYVIETRLERAEDVQNVLMAKGGRRSEDVARPIGFDSDRSRREGP
jgi:hypothetical protein